MIDVLCYLDAADLHRASQTCRRWNNLTSDQLVTMNTFLRKYEGRSPTSTLPLPIGGRGIGMTKSDGSIVPGQQWNRMHAARKQLDRNWQNGHAETKYLFGHTDSVYCVQFDE